MLVIFPILCEISVYLLSVARMSLRSEADERVYWDWELSQNQLKLVQEQIKDLQQHDSKVYIIEFWKDCVEDLFQKKIKHVIGL